MGTVQMREGGGERGREGERGVDKGEGQKRDRAVNGTISLGLYISCDM